MSGVDQLQYLSWLLYLAGFVLVLRRALQRPTTAHIDMTLFFGAGSVVVLLSFAGRVGPPLPTWLAVDVPDAALLTIGYLLMRLVSDFSHVPRLVLRTVELGMAVCILAVVLAPAPLPGGVVLLAVVYLGIVIAYDAWAFARHAGRTRGVTRRRMQAAALASLSIALVIVAAGLATIPGLTTTFGEVSALLALASGVGYFVAFAPPTWLRRTWQEPEMRAFLSRLVGLAGVSDLRAILEELEHSVADAFGAPVARIALWDDDARSLHLDGSELPPSLIDGWVEQRASLLEPDLTADDAAHVAAFGVREPCAVLSAPISSPPDRRLGMLLVFAARSPVFANSDLELIQLLADQTAVFLEARALMDQAAQVRAREEAARLKEDFLSSAAHDLKTPLTGIVTQAQVMMRRAERNPEAPTDLVGLDRLLSQSHRLKELVLELLDVSRLEQGSLVGAREPADLSRMIRDLAQHEPERWKRVELTTEDDVIAEVDEPRFEQVVTNLVENALKYSPPTAAVRVMVWREDGQARMSVRDEGIGVPLEDQPLIFERFHRARNVDDRRYAGMGLGLYIARGIVEQHGGRIWIDSTPGVGSTFHVAVPRATSEQMTL